MPGGIKPEDVERQTTIIDVDGRVVQRPDGSRLLVDAYNVLHRDYEERVAECEEWRAKWVQQEQELKTWREEGEELRRKISKLELDVQTQHLDQERFTDAIANVRTSLSDILTRLFKSAVEEVAADDEAAHEHVENSPRAYGAASRVLSDELKLLQQQRDRLLIVLTTAASNHRRSLKNSAADRAQAECIQLCVGEAQARSAVWAEYAASLPVFTEGIPPQVFEPPPPPPPQPEVADAAAQCDPPPTLPPPPPPRPSIAEESAASPQFERSGSHAKEKEGGRGRRIASSSVPQNSIAPGKMSTSMFRTAERRSGSIVAKNSKDTSSPRPSRSSRHSPPEHPSLNTPWSCPTADDTAASHPNYNSFVHIDVGGKVVSTTSDSLHVGDVITSADGQSIIQQRDLNAVLHESLSHVVVCKVRRNNALRTVELKVPSGTAAAAPTATTTTRKVAKSRTAPKSSATNSQPAPSKLKKLTRVSHGASTTMNSR